MKCFMVKKCLFYSDIDYMNYVNNVFYVKFCLDCCVCVV